MNRCITQVVGGHFNGIIHTDVHVAVSCDGAGKHDQKITTQFAQDIQPVSFLNCFNLYHAKRQFISLHKTLTVYTTILK